MRIAIIGAGVVGQATGRGLIAHRNSVVFVDINPETISKLNNEGYTAISPDELVLGLYDVVFVSVPTLTDYDSGIVMEHLVAATENLADKLKQMTGDTYPVIVYRCTMLPGTTNWLTELLEERCGLTAGVDFGVAYQPEYLRAWAAEEDFANPRAVVLAAVKGDERALDLLAHLYRDFHAPIEVVGVVAAEFQKYVHNNGNAVMVSFFNTMRIMGAALGLTPAELTEIFQITARTADFKAMPQYGTRDRGAYDGACLPKDIAAMIFFMQQMFGGNPDNTAAAALQFMTAAQTVNRALGGN